MISEDLRDHTNDSLVGTVEPRNALEAHYGAYKSWVVLFPEGTNSLSRNLPLLGVRVRAKYQPKRIRVPQCDEYLRWHNERGCVKAPRCRLCGPTQHLEDGHTICDPENLHQYPPKCANYYGPNSADSLGFLFRPRKDNLMLTIKRIEQIIIASSAARLRLKAAYCGVISGKPPAMKLTATKAPETMEATISTPINTRSLFMESLSSSRGGFAVLENIEDDNFITDAQEPVHE